MLPTRFSTFEIILFLKKDGEIGIGFLYIVHPLRKVVSKINNDEDIIDELEFTPEIDANQPESGPVEFYVEAEESGMRLDAWLASRLPRYSRVTLRQAITNGGVTIDDFNGLAKPAFRIKPGQKITLVLPELPKSAPIPENIPLEILYEDESLAVINKPYGMVVHPSRGHWAGTLVGALAFHFQENLSQVRGVARPGIVHRLDRDTSGAIIVAKTDFAHMKLAEQFEKREIQKEYIAICSGAPLRDRDVIEAPIGPHPHQSEKMAIRFDCDEAKPAKTFYEVLRRYRGYSLVKALPKTGRTHQIRLHFTHAGFPILCDRLYGGRAEITEAQIRGNMASNSMSGEESETQSQPILTRQALHAHRVQFHHPETGEILEISAPLPADMKAVLEALEKWRTL